MWQPIEKDELGFVGAVLTPARRVRNTFAHNARLAFDSEEIAVQHIDALLTLLAVLPVPHGRAGARDTAVRELTRMRQLGPTTTGKYDDMRDELTTLDSQLEACMGDVVRYMLDAGKHETAELRELVSATAFQQGCAPMPRRLAPPASGGAGRGAGAGGPDDEGGEGGSGDNEQGQQEQEQRDHTRLEVLRRTIARATSLLQRIDR